MLPSKATVLVMLLWVTECQSLSLEVDEQKGVDSMNCLTSSSGQSCQTLEFIADNINQVERVTLDGITVEVTSSKLVLSKVVMFSHISNFTIQGDGNTTIFCDDGAGLQFVNSSDLNMFGFTIKGCTAKANENASHSLLVLNCTNVSLANLTVSHSFGGLSLVNADGHVLIDDCIFQHNSGIGGVLLSLYQPGARSYYTLSNCTFIENVVESDDITAAFFRKMSVADANGGGLALHLLQQESIHNDIEIINCSFHGNRAKYGKGGGLYVSVCESCRSNLIVVSGTRFIGNTAREGGGMYIAVTSSHYNEINFTDCIIEKNRGKYGGGVALSVLVLSNHHNLIIKYKFCKFLHNHGNISAAVDVNRKEDSLNAAIKILWFIDCWFKHNEVGEVSQRYTSSAGPPPTGILFTFRVHVYFCGSVTFEDNRGTALYVSNAKIVFENSKMLFRNNTGDMGGAILLLGDAFIKSNGGNRFVFRDNTAFYGGALCTFNFDSRYFQFTGNCFLQKEYIHYNHLDVFEFINNTASTNIAHDIFVSNLKPCLNAFHCPNSTDPASFFHNHSKCLGNISFSPSTDHDTSYATITDHIRIQTNYKIFPGIPINLNLLQPDQLGVKVGELFPLSASFKEDTSIVIDEHDAINTGGFMRFRGKPGDSAVLVLQSNTIATLRTSTSIHISDCPPGFYFNSSLLACVCFQNQFYLIHCSQFRAEIKVGNWAGYLNINNTSDETFAVGACVFNFCTYPNANISFRYYLLPTARDELEKFVCGDHRQGVLCGSCVSGYTAYYNSPSLKCGTQDLCSYGILFYILSEIVPVTVFFLAIIIFNIPLTSGSLYSFIFYAQFLDIFYINVYGGVKFEGFAGDLVDLYKILYGVFNLQFFKVERLSFCFLREMNAMDLFMIQYGTVLYATILIFVSVLILRVNLLRMHCIRVCHRIGKRNIGESITNGLSAVVILYYFKCFDLMCSILIPTNIYINDNKNRTVALFNGDLEYLKGDHLKYAIPAFICLFLVILPLPLCLLCDFALVSLMKRFTIVQNNSLVIVLYKLRLKLKHVLRSFQKCFQEDRQCFAGLFFVYRLLLILPKIIAHSSISTVYSLAEVILFVILTVHFLFQPFRKPWQNKLDIFLLVNLLFVNMITVKNYYTRNIMNYANSNKMLLYIMQAVQIFLISLPLIYIGALGFWKTITEFKLLPTFRKALIMKCQKVFDSPEWFAVGNDLEEEDNPFPARLMEEESEISYDTFKDNDSYVH